MNLEERIKEKIFKLEIEIKFIQLEINVVKHPNPGVIKPNVINTLYEKKELLKEKIELLKSLLEDEQNEKGIEETTKAQKEREEKIREFIQLREDEKKVNKSFNDAPIEEMCIVCKFYKQKGIFESLMGLTNVPMYIRSKDITNNGFCRKYPNNIPKQNTDWCGEFKPFDK